MSDSRDAAGRYDAQEPTDSNMERFCASSRAGFLVYAIVNTINGKRYYGSSRNVRRRMWAHLLSLRHGRHHSIALQRAFVKYGELVFDVEILSEHDDHRAALIAEQSVLDVHYGRRGCYNASPDADSPILTPLALERAAEAHRHSAKWRANLRVDQLQTPASRAKGKAACLSSGVFRENVLAQGRRMRALLSKAVVAVPVAGGAELRFSSQTEASQAVGVSRAVISGRCRGVLAVPAGGYYWQFSP